MTKWHEASMLLKNSVWDDDFAAVMPILRLIMLDASVMDANGDPVPYSVHKLADWLLMEKTDA